MICYLCKKQHVNIQWYVISAKNNMLVYSDVISAKNNMLIYSDILSLQKNNMLIYSDILSLQKTKFLYWKYCESKVISSVLDHMGEFPTPPPLI